MWNVVKTSVLCAWIRRTVACHNVFMTRSLLLFATSESVPSGESQNVAVGDEDTLDEYQELSTREEQDIESMMEMCEFAISNAEAFAEQLSRELQVLDGVSAAKETLIITVLQC